MCSRCQRSLRESEKRRSIVAQVTDRSPRPKSSLGRKRDPANRGSLPASHIQGKFFIVLFIVILSSIKYPRAAVLTAVEELRTYIIEWINTFFTSYNLSISLDTIAVVFY